MELTGLSVDRYLRDVLVTLHITGLIMLIAQSAMQDLSSRKVRLSHIFNPLWSVPIRENNGRVSMYLRPDEVAQVLERTGFIRDYVTDKAYGFHKGDHYVYVNREARMGRTALVIHPALGQKSLKFAHPAEPLRSSVAYTRFPQDPHAVDTAFVGIPHGFTSRARLSQYLEKMFQ